MAKEYTEEQVVEGFEKALEEGTLTDQMGNAMTEDDLFSVNPEEVNLNLSFTLNVLKSMQGEVLTIIDATFTDEKRLKFVKDLIKRSFNSFSYRLCEFTQEYDMKTHGNCSSNPFKK